MVLQSSIFWDAYPEGYEYLAGIDESQAYEVDVTEIYKNGDKIVLVTASGCSCWSGEYETREFDSFDELQEHLKSAASDNWQYNPSPSGIQILLDKINEASIN